LTDLPDEFSELRQIRILRIKYNQLSRLPAAVFRLSQLVTLELSGNQIVMLDSSIAKVGVCLCACHVSRMMQYNQTAPERQVPLPADCSPA